MNAINYMSNGKEILEDEVTKGKEVRAYGDEPNPKNPKTGKPKPAVYLCFASRGTWSAWIYEDGDGEGGEE